MYILQPPNVTGVVNFILTLNVLVWLPVWIGRWIMTWATAFAAITVMYPHAKESRTIILLFNLFFIIFPFIALVPLVVFTALAQRYDMEEFKLFAVSDLFAHGDCILKFEI